MDLVWIHKFLDTLHVIFCLSLELSVRRPLEYKLYATSIPSNNDKY